MVGLCLVTLEIQSLQASKQAFLFPSLSLPFPLFIQANITPTTDIHMHSVKIPPHLQYTLMVHGIQYIHVHNKRARD